MERNNKKRVQGFQGSRIQAIYFQFQNLKSFVHSNPWILDSLNPEYNKLLREVIFYKNTSTTIKIVYL